MKYDRWFRHIQGKFNKGETRVKLKAQANRHEYIQRAAMRYGKRQWRFVKDGEDLWVYLREQNTRVV